MTKNDLVIFLAYPAGIERYKGIKGIRRLGETQRMHFKKNEMKNKNHMFRGTYDFSGVFFSFPSPSQQVNGGICVVIYSPPVLRYKQAFATIELVVLGIQII